MAVVIQNATKGVLFGYDESTCSNRILNLKIHFNNKPFNVKVLDNGGLDIVVSGNAFISDIVFQNKNNKHIDDFYKIKSDYYLLSPEFYNENKNSYINKLLQIIAHDTEGEELNVIYSRFATLNMRTVDYFDPVNWALTYKMRGFSDVISDYCPNHKLIDSPTAFAISFNLRLDQDFDDEDEFEDEDTDDDSQSENEWYDAYESDTSYDRDYILSVLHKTRPQSLTPKHLKALKKITSHCLYVEYETTPEHIEIKERQLPMVIPERSGILDLYEKGSAKPYGTLIWISQSPSLTDYTLPDNEERFAPGINYYSNYKGIVLLGHHHGRSMFYGRAVAENIYIPDLFYDSIHDKGSRVED